jgi:hypothetical protein
VTPRKDDENSGKINKLMSNKTPTAVKIGYSSCVTDNFVTAVAVLVRLTTETIINSNTKRNSLGVCDLKNPWHRSATARKSPRIVYAAGASTSYTRLDRYNPNMDHPIPTKAPETARMRASAIIPNLLPGCPNTVVIGARYAAFP